MALWSFSLAVIQKQRNDLEIQSMKGLFFEAPFASSAMLITIFSVSGFPLLASFPILMLSWSTLASKYLSIILFACLATSLLFFAGVRMLINFITPNDQEVKWQRSESTTMTVYLTIGVLINLALGFLPQYLLPYLINLGAQLAGFG